MSVARHGNSAARSSVLRFPGIYLRYTVNRLFYTSRSTNSQRRPKRRRRRSTRGPSVCNPKTLSRMAMARKTRMANSCHEQRHKNDDHQDRRNHHAEQDTLRRPGFKQYQSSDQTTDAPGGVRRHSADSRSCSPASPAWPDARPPSCDRAIARQVQGRRRCRRVFQRETRATRSCRSGYQLALTGTYNPSRAIRPLIDCARNCLISSSREQLPIDIRTSLTLPPIDVRTNA